MTGPFVTCLMPTFNRRAFVPQAIARFLAQDYEPRELLVVDDGDDPAEDLVPPSGAVRYLRLDRRHTIGAKRNIGCEAARGDLVLHWDDDDWMAPWRVRYQAAALSEGLADICGIDRVLYHDLRSGRSYQYVYPQQARPWVAGNSLCYTRAFWQAHPFPSVNIGEDMRFVWNCATARLRQLADNRFLVATIHTANASPKRPHERRWQPYSTAEIAKLVGGDWPLGRE